MEDEGNGSGVSAIGDPRSRGPEAVVVAVELVEMLRQRLTCQSKEAVMSELGISSNTWLKMKRGEPVRKSTVDTLVARLAIGA